MTGKNIVIGLGVIIVILLGVLLFSKPSTAPVVDDQTSTPTQATSSDAGTDTGVAQPSVREFTVTGSNFSFAPSTLAVRKGDTVKITFKNANGMHDFKLDEFNVATKMIQGGAQETVTFVASKAGSFEYYCSVGTHRQMGMKGTLVVTE